MRKFKGLAMPAYLIDWRAAIEIGEIRCAGAQDMDTCRHIECVDCLYSSENAEYLVESLLEEFIK